MKTADRPHIITILVSLSALMLSLFSLQQSCSAQRATKATSRAMLVLKSAQLTNPNPYILVLSPDDPATMTNFKLLFQVENVGKAIAHNPSLQFYLEGNSRLGLEGVGTIKFMDDPPGTPVVGEGGVILYLGKRGEAFLHGDKRGEAFPDTLNLHYRLSYDDEATGAHFDERESCGQFSVGQWVVVRALGRPTPQLPESRAGSSSMLPCPPK